MKTKDRLLKMFEENRGVYFSGEVIAVSLGVSRAAVWKAVKSLTADGYDIKGVKNKGYCLSEKTDIISASGVGKYLDEPCRGLTVEVVAETTSTNALLKSRADGGASDGTVIIALRQTGGRGRLGRTFYSPENSGIYLSILLKPDGKSPRDAVKLTTLAAVAACEAIEKVTDKTAVIKWVNDVFVDGKKVCGILTEASFGLETGLLEYAVLGIGFNAYAPQGGFPKELENIAGAIFDAPRSDGKNRLTAEFLNAFMRNYSAENLGNYPEEYRKRCFVVGKEVDVISKNEIRTATAVSVDDECRLTVRYGDGSTETLSSGEIGVRPRRTEK